MAHQVREEAVKVREVGMRAACYHYLRKIDVPGGMYKEFCQRHGTEITVMNGETFSLEEELVRNLLAVVTVFSARLHGLRSHKNLIRAAALGKAMKDDQGA
jgi:predicted site-specific integrase-resolvase